MLSWWSRYIGISPYFGEPVRLTIENNRITGIEGGDEAAALKSFLAAMKERAGDGVYDFNAFHFGVHPQAIVAPHQCPNVLHRRVIEHSHSSNIHVHIGAPPSTPSYPYWMHCTGDIRRPTLKVGETLVYDKGHLSALDSPAVKAVAQKYPGRPGLDPMPQVVLALRSGPGASLDRQQSDQRQPVIIGQMLDAFGPRFAVCQAEHGGRIRRTTATTPAQVGRPPCLPCLPGSPSPPRLPLRGLPGWPWRPWRWRASSTATTGWS